MPYNEYMNAQQTAILAKLNEIDPETNFSFSGESHTYPCGTVAYYFQDDSSFMFSGWAAIMPNGSLYVGEDLADVTETLEMSK